MFNYDDAFSRNIGWVTEGEQHFIKSKKIAIAGMGGVGSEHLITLLRLGIEKFNISDFDDYEVHNFNRQAGAYMSTVDKPKCQVMHDTALDINPDASINTFPEGINNTNVDAFLDDVDVYVDSLDFFALDARKLVFKKCEEKRIPVITAAPLGMGTALLCFTPGSMSFTEYFDFQTGDDENTQLIKFLIGLSPAMLQRNYLVDPSRADFIAKKGPSTVMAVKLCAGVAASFTLKILLNRGDVPIAPKGLHFDAYNNKLKTTWRPWGNKNPIQRLAFKIAKSIVLKEKAPRPETSSELSPIERTIEIAKWAPSGDNTQVWRFEITSDTSCIIHGTDTRDWVVYDLEGNASKLALGCLLENFDLAAKASGYKLDYELTGSQVVIGERQRPVGDYKISVSLTRSEPEYTELDKRLHSVIQLRTTQRRSMGTTPLSSEEKAAFDASLPDGFSLIWKETSSERFQVGKLLYGNAFTRLSMKEGFEVHSKILEFTPRSKDKSAYQDANDELSRDKIPAKALGLGPAMLLLTKKSLESWPFLEFTSKLGGTILPRLLLDLIPAYRSSAIFALTMDKVPKTDEDYIQAGRAVQRVWLMSAALNMGFQPCQTPVIFSEYLRKGVKFTDSQVTIKNAEKMETQFKQLFGQDSVSQTVFMGRVGRTETPRYRSVRLSLKELLIATD